MKKTIRISFTSLILLLGLHGFCQYSLDFNGGTDYVVLNGVDLVPPWSVEFSISKNESDNYQHLLTSTDGNSGIRTEQYYGTRVGFTQSGVADWYFSYSLPLNQWVNLAITSDGTQTRLYVNGTLKSTVNASIGCPLKWISKNNTEASLKAKLDELRVWDTVLDAAVIAQYSGLPVDSTHPGWIHLQHYYKFDEGSGDTCHDSKGTLNGAIHGPVWYIQTEHDAGVSKLVTPERTSDNYGFAEPLVVRIKNSGSQDITADFTVSYTMNGGTPVVYTVAASSEPLLSNQSIDVAFPPVDLNTSGTYQFRFYTALPGDENPNNDTLKVTLISQSNVLGGVTNLTSDSNTALIACGASEVRVIFYSDEVFRIWLAPGGLFTNPAGSQIVVKTDYPMINIQVTEQGDHYNISSGKLVLRADKSPLKFTLYEKETGNLVWKEYQGLDWGPRTFQYLEPQSGENFYGCGMQNGRFSHKGTKVRISLQIENWDDGAVPNPAPFYMSTAGYGAFRNTFTEGEYDFRGITSAVHGENRFDCFYFYGPGLKDILNRYTELTGRPFLPPRWGLEFGDADCYNKDGQTTPDVIPLVADKYRENDLPGGWILPNDGYGCGYTALDSVVEQLHQRGFYTGLWTENGVSQIAWEVGVAGTRACKLDVAWVGSGYQFALGACKTAYSGIEDNCNARGYVWSVCGWAGTQRYSVIWSGDQSGSYEYIRFHIPTFIGAGLSGFNCASSDVDGIFGGSGGTYARDLQWKTFIPVTYAMSGWANSDKHPWNYGASITDINRKYLKLKMRLIPYLYSYCHEAAETGVPTVRALVLEFPEDTLARGKTTQYQFMSGEWLLVAPVFKAGSVRDSIYLPAGKWIDYWNGTIFQGPVTLNGYSAPLSTIPVFVRAGAIIPMYPEMLYDNEKPKDPVTFDVYPNGETAFNLYEDDGVTREYRNNGFSVTRVTCNATIYGAYGDVTLSVGASVGEYTGRQVSRGNLFTIHYPRRPVVILLNDSLMTGYLSMEEYEAAPSGWFWEAQDTLGILYVKTASRALSEPFTVKIKTSTATDEKGHGSGLRVYPNPTEGKTEIWTGDDSIREYRVYTANGKMVRSGGDRKGNKIALDLSDLPEGTYFVEIKTNKGTYSQKVTLAQGGR